MLSRFEASSYGSSVLSAVRSLRTASILAISALARVMRAALIALNRAASGRPVQNGAFAEGEATAAGFAVARGFAVASGLADVAGAACTGAARPAINATAGAKRATKRDRFTI